MRKLLLTTAAAFAVAAIPAVSLAQDPQASVRAHTAYTLNADQQAIYDAWPPDRQAVYIGWPYDYQAYYWTLDPVQQDAYWVLTPEQRVQVYAMTPAQRANAWTSIVAQYNSRNAAVRTGTAADIARYNANPPTVQPVPPPAKSYPVCKGAIQDSCINPREAGLNWGNRPLPYWPGRPASEG